MPVADAIPKTPAAVSRRAQFEAAWGQSMSLLLRRRRLLLLSLIVLVLPLIPVLLAFDRRGPYAPDGADIFQLIVEMAQLGLLAPLLALFFAALLIAEDAENNTIVYLLTRPLSRTLWVLGRFAAYIVVASVLLSVSIGLTFLACSTLANFDLTSANLGLLLRYLGLAVLAITAYGGLMIFLGAAVKRPILVGILVIYFWQGMAMAVPGLIDFLTIQKYIDALLPRLATQRDNPMMNALLSGYQRDVLVVEGLQAGLALGGITAVFLGLTVWMLRAREYGVGRAAGS